MAGNRALTDGPDAYGKPTSGGYNPTRDIVGGPAATDVVNTNARLGPARNIGGLADTHALEGQSSVVDRG